MKFSINAPYTMATMTFGMVDSFFRSFWCMVSPSVCEEVWPKNSNDPDVGYSSHFVEDRE